MTRKNPAPVASWRYASRGSAMAAARGGTAAGAAAWLADADAASDALWIATILVALVPLALAVLRDLRRGETGVDVIALLALVGALALGEYAAGAVIGLMLASAGIEYAGARARRSRRAAGRRIVTVREFNATSPPLADGARSPARQAGRVVPVDGRLQRASAAGRSVLTGEARLVDAKCRCRPRSTPGSVRRSYHAELSTNRHCADFGDFAPRVSFANGLETACACHHAGFVARPSADLGARPGYAFMAAPARVGHLAPQAWRRAQGRRRRC
jgi:hypothetical protein